MILFKGKMGTVLHTGDFRFSENMFKNPFLFPSHLRNNEMKGISIPIDYLFLDNTFANPSIDFPNRDEAYLGLSKIVKEHQQYRIFVFTYYLGKEEVLLKLAEEFETCVN